MCPWSSDQCFPGFVGSGSQWAMAFAFVSLQEWAAKMVLHNRPGSEKLIKRTRPLKSGIE
jgi:hypothetical protein